MTVYVDVIFLENLIMNFIILYAVGIILKLKIKISNILISSTLGSVYAILVYISDIVILSNMFLKISLSISMIYLAFKPKTLKGFLRQFIIFYLVSFTFGGISFMLLYFIMPQGISIENGVMIGTSTIKIILMGGIIGFSIITIAFRSIKEKLNKKDMICKINIKNGKKEVIIKAIIDTGNFLKDPINKYPVIVVEKDVLKNIIPEKILSNIQNIITGNNIDIGEYTSKIRLIPYSSIGKQNGMLIGIKSTNMEIYYDEKVFVVENVIIGVYDGKIGKSNEYQALVGLECLEREGECKRNECSKIVKI